MLALIVLVTICASLCMSCDSPNDKPCLFVFNNEPKNLPKCYCQPDICPVPLEVLKKNCTSGQLHPDECSTCLKCARSRGQSCGGHLNQEGECAIGLRCLVKFNVPRVGDGRAEENHAIGKCVPESSSLCPGPDVEHLQDGVNCRPGRLGILADALYCQDERLQLQSNRPAAVDTPQVVKKPPPGSPSLIQILLQHVPTVPFPDFSSSSKRRRQSGESFWLSLSI